MIFRRKKDRPSAGLCDLAMSSILLFEGNCQEQIKTTTLIHNCVIEFENGLDLILN